MISPGGSPYPPLSEERIASARAEYGHSVDTYLEHLHIGDPLADDVVNCFDRTTHRKGYRMLMQAIDSGIGSVDNPPAELVALFQQLDHIPSWIEWDRMKLASAKIIRNALLPAMSFAVYALPHAYLATGNKPLAFSNALLSNTARRYAVATRFFTEVFMPGSMRRHADGFRFAVITRILHARIRSQILKSGRWDMTLGLPLNQAHMAMGTIIFSLFVIDGMRRLGGRFRQEDVESILQIWRYVSYLFGVSTEISFTSETEARHLTKVACSLEFDPDENSKLLCRALIEAAPEFLKIENPFVARKFVNLLCALSRRLLGDRLADRLGYPEEKRRLLCTAGISLTWILERFPSLIPWKLRQYMGVRFWIEQGEYDLRMYGVDR
ncbi:MAG: oxygenase MpaB family protein [Acidobacteriota bacterium]|nr:oxygenase MpaB family protein [Acidobacteriota bacterium]